MITECENEMFSQLLIKFIHHKTRKTFFKLFCSINYPHTFGVFEYMHILCKKGAYNLNQGWFWLENKIAENI